ncbi:MAG: tRNA uracil 4-sulfurtransferase ThiI [Acholeplasmataceae bacterium]
MTKQILLRFGDLMLKGRNIGSFLRRIKDHVREKVSDLDVEVEAQHDRMFIGYRDKDERAVLERLSRIPGLMSYSIVYVTEPDFERIIDLARRIIDREIEEDGVRFKIETKRADKSLPLNSQEITQKLAGPILAGAKRRVVVDVRDPEEVLHIEIRKERAYLYLKTIPGLGGYPVGTLGKGLVMMSSGIDSPVSAFLAMKQGIEVELFHFESTPMTPIESVQKVVDNARVLRRYAPKETIRLHLVPFRAIHSAILDYVPSPYTITVMRRMMYRLAERFVKKNRLLTIITGESIGQVASQTLQSLKAIEVVTSFPIIRPLVTTDKTEIIRIARMIGTFDISTRPFADCCSIYVPKQPATKPMHTFALRYERLFDYEALLEDSLEHIRTLSIGPSFELDFAGSGMAVEEVLGKDYNGSGDGDDHVETEP